jgi:hypothetical protein
LSYKGAPQQGQLSQLDVHNAAGSQLWALQPYMHSVTVAVTARL